MHHCSMGKKNKFDPKFGLPATDIPGQTQEIAPTRLFALNRGCSIRIWDETVLKFYSKQALNAHKFFRFSPYSGDMKA